jgi:hypothetical protein
MAETKETLREFCAAQVQRLSLFRRFDFLEVTGRKEIRNWLESKGERRPAITALMDAAVLLEELPTLAELTRIWIEQQPAPMVAKGDCPHCAGSGFEIVKRGELEGAKRCRCGGVPVADPNLVFVSPRSAVA